jgi:hypothetical protein
MSMEGQYRRAFDWRLTASDRVPTAVAGFAIRKLSQPEHLELLEDLLSISKRRRSNSAVLARLQLWLLSEVVGDENAVKGLKRLAEEKGLTLDGAESPTLEDAASKLRNALQNGLHFHRARANCIRQIGDGIAWRCFGYDRAVLRLLSQRSTKQQTLAEGTAHELQEWARTFDNNHGVPILNAITNVLAIGDVTVAKPDGSGEIIEVKASKATSRRLTRQKRKMREVVELLNFGHGEVDEKELTLLRFDMLPENDLQALLELLDRASIEGWSAGRISPCCYVECMNSAVLKNSKDAIANFEAFREAEAVAFIAKGDYVSEMTSLDVLAFTPNCAPFSIFPFPAKRCVELMIGATAYKSYFNESAFFRELESKGWRFKRSAAQIVAESRGFATAADVIGEVEKDGMRISIPPSYVTRMQMEMLSPGAIIRELEELKRVAPQNEPHWNFVLYGRESEIWD